jgi:hypothetical protein
VNLSTLKLSIPTVKPMQLDFLYHSDENAAVSLFLRIHIITHCMVFLLFSVCFCFKFYINNLGLLSSLPQIRDNWMEIADMTVKKLATNLISSFFFSKCQMWYLNLTQKAHVNISNVLVQWSLSQLSIAHLRMVIFPITGWNN